MKKILLYAVALFTAIGCHKAPSELGATDPADQLVSITIQAALSDNGDTRATVTPGEDDASWKSSWESDDALTLLSESGSVTTLSGISIDSETGVATFSGSVPVGTYEVYCLGSNYAIDDDGRLQIDYATQAGFNKIPLKSIAPITVTSADETSSFDMLYFEHIAQTMELRVSLPVDGDDQYTLSSIEISGANGEDVDYYGFETIALSMGDKVVSSSDNSFKVYCYLPAFAVAANGSISLTANLGNEDDIPCVATKTVTNTTEAELEFEAGKHNYLTAAFSEINTLKWVDSAAETFAGGVAYSDDVNSYSISSAEELALLAKLTHKDRSMEGKTFTLANDIDLSGLEWNAIDPFKGIFDGAGFTVKGLYINQPGANCQGFFGYIESATIKNLSVAGSVTGNGYTGGVVGRSISNSLVTNCCNAVSVVGGVGGEKFVGGVVGHANDSTVIDCYNTASIKSSLNIGGIVGHAVNSTVVNCYNTASVEGDSYVAGIFGSSSDSTVANCYNTASVKGVVDYIGGIGGYSTGSTTVANCYNTASVVGNDNDDRVGGVVGLSANATISNCYWDNSIENVPDKGIGVDNGNSSNVVGMNTTQMQEPAFAATLSENAYYYNYSSEGVKAKVKAWAWKAVSGSTPEIDTNKIPTIKQLDDITTGVTVGE